MIAMMAPPDVVFGHTASVERAPQQRPVTAALVLCALLNSYPFDWLARQKTAVHLSLYLIGSLPIPAFTEAAEQVLSNAALRLCCNHPGYAALWRAQTGCDWTGSWPMVASTAARWRLRAEADAVVAHAYGLSRRQYDQILASFSHRSFPAAPALCLEQFDQQLDRRAGGLPTVPLTA